MEVLFARFVRFVVDLIELSYGRGICAICGELNRDVIWTCYLCVLYDLW